MELFSSVNQMAITKHMEKVSEPNVLMSSTAKVGSTAKFWNQSLEEIEEIFSSFFQTSAEVWYFTISEWKCWH